MVSLLVNLLILGPVFIAGSFGTYYALHYFAANR